MRLSLRKGLKRLEDAAKDPDDSQIGAAMKKLYELLEHGEYLDDKGLRRPIQRDISKLHKVISLTALQQQILQNVCFMSSHLPGTRQVRKMIGHALTAARIAYGCPFFMTATPSERQSGWVVQFSRYRLDDPGLKYSRPQFVDYAGYNCPSLYLPENLETTVIDLPEYETRRAMASQDPLACLYAFLVNIKIVLPRLYGLRMCPECPHCVESEKPCMDIYGSNATPIGGSAGRCDHMIGAVEAQKAEGVLHLHVFLFGHATQLKCQREVEAHTATGTQV